MVCQSSFEPRPFASSCPPAVARRLIVALVAGALLVGAGEAAFAVDQWQQIGPFGATVLSVAGDPAGGALRLAGGFAGFFRSTTGGAGWERADADLPVRDVAAVLVLTDGTVLVGTFGAGVHRSTDDGASFTPANTGIESASIFGLAKRGGEVWASTAANGIWMTTDQGASWQSRTTGIEGLQVNDVLVLSSGDLLAATGATSQLGGVFRSTDDGASWQDASTGLTNRRVVALATTPDETVLFAGTVLNGIEESGVYRSTDGGASWELSVTGITNFMISDIVVDRDDASIVYTSTQASTNFSTSGIFRSTNAGLTWAMVPGNPSVSDIRALEQLADGSFIAGAAGKSALLGGVFVSADGLTWTRSDAGIAVLRCTTVAASPLEPERIWTGAVGTFREPGGVYRSTDGGTSWAANTSTGMTESILSFLLHPDDPTRRFAGTRSGIFVWNEVGGVWQSSGLASLEVRRLTYAPGGEELEVWAATTQGVRVSTNGGLTWASRTGTIEPVAVQSIVVVPGAPNRVFIATDSQGVFESTDAGASWSERNANLMTLATRDLVYAEGNLLVATDAGIFQLDIGPAPPLPTWQDVSAGLESLDVRDLAVVRDVRVAATADGVFRSGTDDPVPWVADSDGLFNLDVRAVHVDTTAGRLRVFAATQGGAVFLGDEIVPVVLARFAAIGRPGRVELTFETGIERHHAGFRIERRLAEASAFETLTPHLLRGGPRYVYVDEDERLRAGAVAEYALVAVDLGGGEERFGPFRVQIEAETPAVPLFSVAPNPFRSTTRIAFGARSGELTLYDATGRVVMTRSVQANDEAWEWSGEDRSGRPVPSGVYWLRLVTPQAVHTERLVRLR